MQVYGTTVNRALGLWIHFNKVQVWRSSVLIYPFLPYSLETRAPTKPGARQSANPHHSPIPTLPQLLGLQEHVNAQSLPWVLQV